MQQIIDIPTRTRTAISLIDLVYVSSLDLVEEFGTLPEIADHEGTIVCLNIKQKPKRSVKKVVYDYKNANIDNISKYIKEYDFESKVFSFPVKEQAERFSKVLVNCFNEFVPKRIIHLKPKAIPWCNTYTRLLLRKKNRNYKFFFNP